MSKGFVCVFVFVYVCLCVYFVFVVFMAPSVLRGPVCKKTISQRSRHLCLCCLCPWFCLCPRLCRHNKLGMKPFFALLLGGTPGRNWNKRTQCRSRTFCLFVFWPDTAGNRHVVFVYWRKKSWLSNKGKGRRRAKGGKAKSGIKRRWQAGSLLRQVLPHPGTPPLCICLACLHIFLSLKNGTKILHT